VGLEGEEEAEPRRQVIAGRNDRDRQDDAGVDP